MARTAEFNDDMVHASRQVVQEAKTARELRSGLSVLIPKVCGVTKEDRSQTLQERQEVRVENIGLFHIRNMSGRWNDDQF